MDTIHVLHVDDDSSFGDLVQDFVEQEDDRITIHSATSARDGLEQLATDKHTIDCIISDYDMPELDGLEFLELVRQDYPDLPFILFTGKGSEEVASDAIAGGATDYLQKSAGTEQFELLANQVVNAVERYRVQQEHERVYQALETATQGIGILDEHGQYIYVNEAYAELYDRTADDLLDEHWKSLYPDEEVERFRSEILPTLKEQGNWSGRSTGLRSDGTTFTEQLSLTHLDTGGHVCVVQDLSDRIERERELEQKEQRYQAILEDPNHLVALLDVDGTVEDVNHTALQYIDEERESVVGDLFWNTPWWEGGDTAPEELQMWIDRAARGEYVEFEAKHRTTDNEPLYVEGIVRPVTNESDEVISLIISAQDITERKEYEHELEWKTKALEEAPLGVVITDPSQDDNPIISANDHFKELTGYPEEEIRGRNCRFLQGEQTASEPVDEMRTAIDEERPVTVELRNYKQDGTPFWNRVAIAPITDDSGTVTHYVGFQEDVTDRKETEQRLQAYIDNSSDVLGVVNESGEFEKVSAAIERITGYSPTELHGESVFNYIHPDDRNQMIEEFAELREASESITKRVEYRFKQPDGSWVWLETTGQSQTDPHLDGYVVTTRPITERKEQERSLREQNRKITALHQVAADLETCENPDAVYQTIVDAAEDILQLDIGIADAAVGEMLIPRAISSELSEEQYYDQTPIESEDNFAAQAYRTGESIVINDLTVHETNPAKDEFESVLTIPIGDHGVFQSVDREPQAFDETDRYLAELLISHGEARLDQLDSEQQLREHTDTLERQNERLEEFASVVSHDLRNPLNLAVTGLELVKQECESEHLETVEEGHDRMEALIENLLTLAKEDHSTEATETVDLARLSRKAWEMVGTDDATLQVNIDKEITADRERVRQLLSNLMRNSIEHGGDGVTVEIGELSNGFYVEDDGQGIPPAEQERVFESGFTTVEEGTGFGLSIVAEVVKDHDWRIDITDGEDGGARFEITYSEV